MTFFGPQFLSRLSRSLDHERTERVSATCMSFSCWLASALHAASSARAPVVRSQLERIHLDHTPYAGAGVPQHTRHRRCRSGAGHRIPTNQCAASVTTSRAPAHSARTDRNTHHTHHTTKTMTTTNVADDDAARLAALIGDSDSADSAAEDAEPASGLASGRRPRADARTRDGRRGARAERIPLRRALPRPRTGGEVRGRGPSARAQALHGRGTSA